MNLSDILERTTQVAAHEVREELPNVEKNYQWHEKGMRAMQREGLMGLVIPEKYGGLGQGLYALARTCEVLGMESASMGLCFGMHNVGAAVIAAKATDYQVEHYLKPICEGQHITTLSLSESGTGAHFYYPQTTLLAESEESFLVNGKKTFTTNGNHADSYVVSTVAADPDAPMGHFSCVLVDQGIQGMVWEDPWQGIGMRGNSSMSMNLNNIHLPTNNLLGESGDQIWYIFNVVAPYFLIAMSGTYMGIATAAFEEAKNHLLERTHSHTGMNLASIGIMQYKIAEMWLQLEKMKQYVYYAANEGDRGGENAMKALCGAKVAVAQTTVHLVNEAMTICGGRAYRDGAKMERLMRDARAAHVMSPTTDLLLTWVGRMLLDQAILD